jgi:hypothetical protein
MLARTPLKVFVGRMPARPQHRFERRQSFDSIEGGGVPGDREIAARPTFGATRTCPYIECEFARRRRPELLDRQAEFDCQRDRVVPSPFRVLGRVRRA